MMTWPTGGPGLRCPRNFDKQTYVHIQTLIKHLWQVHGDNGDNGDTATGAKDKSEWHQSVSCEFFYSSTSVQCCFGVCLDPLHCPIRVHKLLGQETSQSVRRSLCKSSKVWGVPSSPQRTKETPLITTYK